MDAIGRVKKINNKGVAVVYIALMIVVLVAFVSLAVDLGYIYVAKGQLQNAADAAALAGATQLPNSIKVKAEAVKFALANKAAGDDVVITDADIYIGNWNAALTPKFLAGRSPINAVRAVARRDVAGAAAAGQGMVPLFFGRIFSLLPNGGAGWSEMGVVAEAIATHPPRPGAGILLCDQWCSPTATPPGTLATLYWDREYATSTQGNGLGLDPKYIVAFSEYRDEASTDFSPNSPIMQYIKGTADTPIASTLCGQHVFSNNAAPGNLFNNNGAMVNRLAAEKTTEHPYWEMIVPLVRSAVTGACFSPDVQGFGNNLPGERYEVTRFMKIRVSTIDGQPHPSMATDFQGCIECSDIDIETGVWTSQLVK
ncbi:MAG: pilus assembly protein TadG-related protein [Desulfuromonadaceae bacterium]